MDVSNACQHAPLAQNVAVFIGRQAVRRDIQHHNIAFHTRLHTSYPQRLERIRKNKGVSVVIAQVCDIVAKRVECGSGNYAALPHIPTQKFPGCSSPANKFCAAAEQRADRSAQAFGYTEHDRICIAAKLTGVDLQCMSGIKYPGTVHMYRD